MNRYTLRKDPEPWIALPNNGGEVGDMADIVDELNKLKWERDLLALLASEKPEFFNPLHAALAVELRDKILQQNSQLSQPKSPHNTK